jgi:hypothetical protein
MDSQYLKSLLGGTRNPNGQSINEGGQDRSYTSGSPQQSANGFSKVDLSTHFRERVQGRRTQSYLAVRKMLEHLVISTGQVFTGKTNLVILILHAVDNRYIELNNISILGNHIRVVNRYP